METAIVRYFVDDVPMAVDFYTRHLGFSIEFDRAPAVAAVNRGALQLLLSGPVSSGARPMPDGSRPEPGGWNRVQLIVEDLESEIGRLRAAGVPFRNDIVSGPGGRQVLLEDPSGNPIELFTPASADE